MPLRNAAGGLFIWLTLPAAVTTAELMPVAWRHGVTFARGECFYAQEQLGAHGLRLNFAANSPPQIEEGTPGCAGRLRR